MIIDASLVRRLVDVQFPQWKGLPILPVAHSGWDNRTFHLGAEMVVRLPSALEYASQLEKEQRWLPKLAPFLPLQIPLLLAIGKPSEEYPWKWSIYRWLEGEAAAIASITDLNDFVTRLAQFLIALQRIDAINGPPPGPHSFYRGGALATYDAETRQAIAVLKGKIDGEVATKVWEAALETTWQGSPVWVHGDISSGNLLVNKGRLSAVIDFGQLTVGDPACDLAIAWTLFRGQSRDLFRRELALDAATWARGRAWALWKALIIAAGLCRSNSVESELCWRVIEEILTSIKRT